MTRSNKGGPGGEAPRVGNTHLEKVRWVGWVSLVPYDLRT